MPTDLANAITNIQADYAAGAYNIVTGDVKHLTGRPPRTLEDVLDALSARLVEAE
jgi:NAD(P)H dehydrogenase (quinone)